MTEQIWVLTEDFDDYDQHGEYFIHAWNHKPTREELIEQGVEEHRTNTKDYIGHVLSGGGRVMIGNYYDHYWYNLKEIKCK